VLDLANPRAGDVLSTGDIVISGDAFVPSAAPLTGVSRVDLFLGARDNGGLFIGSTVPVGKEFQVTADVPNSENVAATSWPTLTPRVAASRRLSRCPYSSAPPRRRRRPVQILS